MVHVNALLETGKKTADLLASSNFNERKKILEKESGRIN
jgi:hypothetical protein